MGTGLGFLGGLLGVHLLLLSVNQFRWNIDSQYLGAWYDKKDRIANAIPGPKILFAGGSNVQYGIRAGIVEKSLGVAVVNYGIHAALPFSYILHRVQRVAKPGDTVVLIPEYEYYFRDPFDSNKVSINYLSICDQEFLRHSFLKYIHFLFTVPSDIMFARLFTDSKKITDQVKGRYAETESLFDHYGDRNGTSKAKMGDRESRLIETAHATSLAHATPDKYSPFLPGSVLEQFISWCHENRIQLEVGYPNTIYFSEYNEQSAREFLAFHEVFFKKRNIDALMTPQATMLPKEDFFDTVYHLNEEGAIKRTEMIIPELQRHGL